MNAATHSGLFFQNPGSPCWAKKSNRSIHRWLSPETAAVEFM
ncbi:hypothetical protein [Rhodococcus sp. MTM3W5.2]|nr:hypothetical protein [Rhodococcus sp. MTM3W5.2]